MGGNNVCGTCGPQPGSVPKIIVGQDKNLIFQLLDQVTGNPIDLTAATAITAKFFKADGTILTKSLGSGITLTLPAAGKFVCELLIVDTSLLQPSPILGYSDCEVSYTIGGKLIKVLLQNSISILEDEFA